MYSQTTAATSNLCSNFATNLRIAFSRFGAYKQVIEIRILNTQHGVVSGLFTADDAGAEAFAHEIGRLHLEKHTAYQVLNLLSDDYITGKPLNKLLTHSKTTAKDADITAIHFIMTDFDPVRPAKTSATDAEKSIALERLNTFCSALEQEGLVPAITTDSGNGYNAYFRVDFPNDSEHVKLIKDFNTICHSMFSDDKVDFDRTVTNPARIAKLPGTWAVKGENTPERPHRQSAILSSTDSVVSKETLVAFVTNHQEFLKQKPSTTKTPGAKSGLKEKPRTAKIPNVVQYIEEHEWTYKVKENDDSTLYILDICPMNHAHDNAAAFIQVFHDSGKTMFKCHHNGCSEYGIHDLLERYPMKNRPPLMPDDDKLANLYNQIVTYADFLQSESRQLYIHYHNGISVLAAFDSNDTNELLHHVGISQLQTIYTPAKVSAVKESLRPIAKSYAQKAVIGNRIASKDNLIFYAVDRDKIISVKDGNICRYTGNQVYFAYNDNFVPQAMPDFQSPAEALPALIDEVFHLNPSYRLRFLAQLCCFFLPHLSTPLLVLSGGHGTAKTTTAKKIIDLVDPRVVDVVSTPDKEDGLTAILSSNYICAFDNVQKITSRYSDLLCIACTGGYSSKRKLYSDNTLIDVPLKSHVIMNGIGDYVSRPDLAERANVIHLEQIQSRIPERQVWEIFRKQKPAILGSIFHVLRIGLPMVDELSTQLTDLPRMADFCLYGAAFIKAMGLDYQQFLNEYRSANQAFVGECATTDPFCGLILQFMELRGAWNGTSTELLAEFKTFAKQNHLEFSVTTASSLSRKLHDHKIDLLNMGWEVTIKSVPPKSVTIRKVGDAVYDC